jgi:short subunit dehydrogenase-like uncharacterized protein
MADREHDIALFGATGFTGGLTAEYLAAHAPPTTRWALAGRSAAKLERVRARLAAVHPECSDLPLVEADAGDAASMGVLAESARVVITTVGPYVEYGEAVVAACAAAGTDYVDLTGEPEFVDLMWLRYHELALRSGARLVHSCGFDSIPYDLGALFTVTQLPEGVPIRLEGFVAASGRLSGGTYRSAIEILGRLGSASKVAGERRRLEPGLVGRRVRGVTGAPRRTEFGGGWAVPLPTIDPVTVLRSARALERYGPDFSYSHYGVVKQLPVLAGMTAGAGAAVALAQLGPTRELLLKFAPVAGAGPSEQQRLRSWFRVRFAGEGGEGGDGGDGGSGRVHTEVTGGDPGYGETSKMLAESALCLAHDELPQRAGQLTPAVAMGDALIARLQAARIGFSVLESSGR